MAPRLAEAFEHVTVGDRREAQLLVQRVEEIEQVDLGVEQCVVAHHVEAWRRCRAGS
jgi:hypothetical protein